MSGTLIPTMARGIDPTAAFGAYNSMLKTGAEIPLTQAQTGLAKAQTGESQARTGMIGAQTTGENIKNQLAALPLPYYRKMYGQMANPGGAWQQPGPLPWDKEGTANAGTVAEMASGSASSGYGQGGGGGTAGAIGTGTIGGQPSAVPTGGGGLRGGPSNEPFTGPGGIMLPSGIAVPLEDFAGWQQAQDKPGAMKQIIANKNTRLSQLVASTIDPATGRPDPQAWNAAVKHALYGGLIDNVQAAQFYDHPKLYGSVQASTVAPNEQPSMKGAQEAATTQAHNQAAAPWELVDVQVPNPDGTFRTLKMTRADALQRGQGGGQTVGQLAATPGPVSGQDYANRVQAGENPGGNPAQTNTSGPGGTPTSSAMGNHQFENDTWVHVISRERPDLVANKSREQILAMRTDPSLSSQMTQAYGKENAGILANANLPINAATLGLAHGFGGDGAIRILRSAPGTPMTAVFPPNADGSPNEVIAANPTYASETAGSMFGHYMQRFGLVPVDFSNAGAAATPPGTIGAGPSEFTPDQTVKIGMDRDQIKEDAPQVTAAQTGAMHASSSMPVLLSVRDLAARIPTGSFGEARTGIANFLQTFSPEWANRFVAAVSNIDPSKAGAMQEFVKQTFQTVTSAESQLAGARIGARLTEFFSKAMPNINMQGDAVRDMVNFLLVGNQMVKDYGQGAATHYNASRDAFEDKPTVNRYQPLSKYDQSWLASDGAHAPAVYEAAAMALNRRPFAEWSKGLSPVQKHALGDIIRAADPQNGGLFNSKGAWVSASAFPAAGSTPPEPTMATAH